MSAETCMGLALHKGIGSNSDLWAISHISTGLRIIHFHTRLLAYGCMIELAYSTDWYQVNDSKETQEALKPIIVPVVKRWQVIEKQARGEETT